MKKKSTLPIEPPLPKTALEIWERDARYKPLDDRIESLRERICFDLLGNKDEVVDKELVLVILGLMHELSRDMLDKTDRLSDRRPY